MDDYLDQDERIERLRGLVDDLCDKIRTGELTLGEAKKEAALVRLKAQKLIPFEMEKFDLIYKKRFERLIQQFLSPRPKDDSSK